MQKKTKEYGNEITTSLMLAKTVPGKLYDLIKVHKQGNPARPVDFLHDKLQLNHTIYRI